MLLAVLFGEATYSAKNTAVVMRSERAPKRRPYCRSRNINRHTENHWNCTSYSLASWWDIWGLDHRKVALKAAERWGILPPSVQLLVAPAGARWTGYGGWQEPWIHGTAGFAGQIGSCLWSRNISCLTFKKYFKAILSFLNTQGYIILSGKAAACTQFSIFLL